MRRNLTIRQLVNSGGLDELQSFGQSLANTFDAVRIDFGRGGNGPHGKTLSCNAGASQNALLCRAQLLELHLDQLIQRLWDGRANIFKRHPERPLPIGLCN